MVVLDVIGLVWKIALDFSNFQSLVRQLRLFFNRRNSYQVMLNRIFEFINLLEESNNQLDRILQSCAAETQEIECRYSMDPNHLSRSINQPLIQEAINKINYFTIKSTHGADLDEQEEYNFIGQANNVLIDLNIELEMICKNVFLICKRYFRELQDIVHDPTNYLQTIHKIMNVAASYVPTTERYEFILFLFNF